MLRSLRSCLPILLGGVCLLVGRAARAGEIPADLPHYDLAIRIDTNTHCVQVRERVTWTNTRQRPADELVFCVYPHYKIPDKDFGLLAKTVELLRQNPSDGLDPVGRIGTVEHVRWLGPANAVAKAGGPPPAAVELAPAYKPDNDTALVVPLPAPVRTGESVVVELDYSLKLPNKQGRWGYWEGVTFLVNWLPMLAFYDECGWQPNPFVPWHLPFFHEAGVYTAQITVPCGQKVACSGPIVRTGDLGNGWQVVETAPCPLRDFALFCSDRYQEFCGEVEGVQLKVLAFPEHEFYAREMLRVAQTCLPIYSRWFGAYPYQHFTIAESFFAWNGNQLGAMVMIDERIFSMPHLARGYVEYLLAHEICHQWWYNVVGANGYCETFMDEGPATYYSHRLLDQTVGHNNALLEYPSGLGWMPNIKRENYRYASMFGTIRRGDPAPAVQPMDKYGHVVNLFTGAYDRGSKVMGMIEDRLGEAAFLDFSRIVQTRYRWRVLRVADFQRELEAYTGRSWDDFFKEWVYGAGLVDWSVESVKRSPVSPRPEGALQASAPSGHGETVTVILHQSREIDEQTTLGIRLKNGDGYDLRLPIVPSVQVMKLDDPPATIESLPDHRVRVTVELPCEPLQISVDPDKVLQDANPTNNHWKEPVRWRITPLYSQLEETDLTADYDSWNVIFGPWMYYTGTREPWYQKSSMFGLRLGAYRTQEFYGGLYGAYRTDYRDFVVGADAVMQHWPLSHTEVGFNVERRIGDPIADPGPSDVNRAVVYGRYVFQYASSLYTNPMHYAEVFGFYADNPLPFARTIVPGAERPNSDSGAGIHYHLDYLTPYWDPEGGFRFDFTYTGGETRLADTKPLNMVESAFTYVKTLPAWTGPLADTKVAGRVYVGASAPDQGEQFALGGGSLFRGFDLAERQGSFLWVGNLEWRIPLVKHLHYDVCDNVAGLRGLYVVPFYDVGEIFANGHSVDGVAHAVGLGLRADVAWFGFIERSTIRLDVAKTVNAASPVQFWIGFTHAF